MEEEVLSKKIEEALRGRKVIHALFTTFNFDPGFFELHILPLFFGIEFHQDEVLKKAQLSFRLPEIQGIEVYYDYNVFDATSSASLDYQRVPINMPGAFFHPKTIFLLVENASDEYPSLIVGSGSANLSRAGYWSNVEGYHLVELNSTKHSPYKDGIVDLLRQIKKFDTSRFSDESRPSYNAIYKYLKSVPQKLSTRSSFFGRPKNFPTFLSDKIGSQRGPWILEVLSPFYPTTDDTRLIDKLFQQLNIEKIHLYLPTDDAGDGLIDPKLYENIESKYAEVHWAGFKSSGVLTDNQKGPSRRYLHAKVYRFISRQLKEEYLFIGSINCTHKAFTMGGAPNIEAGFFTKMDSPDTRPMLKPLDDKITRFAKPKEEPMFDEETHFPYTCLRYDWGNHKLEIQSEIVGQQKIRLTIHDNFLWAGKNIVTDVNDWYEIKPDIELLETYLKNTSFIKVQLENGKHSNILVQEYSMAHKPSILSSLSPSQILELWTVLNEDQKNKLLTQFLMLLHAKDISPEYLTKPQKQEEVFFSQFSQIFNAFSSLEVKLEDCLANNKDKQIAYYLLGKHSESIFSLINSTIDSDVYSPALKYILGLTAGSILNRFYNTHKDKLEIRFPAIRQHIKSLHKLLDKIKDNKNSLDLGQLNDQAAEFFRFYEKHFNRVTAIEVQS